MTNPSNSPRFIPLSSASQGNSENVLYYDANAPMDAIYECASARLQAILNLLDILHDFKGSSPNNTAVLSVVASYLLNDAHTLFERLSSISLEYEKEDK